MMPLRVALTSSNGCAQVSFQRHDPVVAAVAAVRRCRAASIVDDDVGFRTGGQGRLSACTVAKSAANTMAPPSTNPLLTPKQVHGIR